MKKLLLKQRVNTDLKTKAFVIREKTMDDECITHIRKGYHYTFSKVTRVVPVKSRHPEVIIRKSVDNKRKLERIHVEVKGYIYTEHEGEDYRVEYAHSLNIHIKWFEQILSPTPQ